jgi:hypothetical protein
MFPRMGLEGVTFLKYTYLVIGVEATQCGVVKFVATDFVIPFGAVEGFRGKIIESSNRFN